MEKKLEGQVAIITGANRGIGAGVAKAMAASGAKLVINHSRPSSKQMAEDICNEISASGGSAISFQADVSKEDEVIKMFSETIKHYGTVDILVSNAGIQKDAPFHEMSLEQWNLVLNVNLTGQFLCAREAVKEFLRRGITNNSLAAGKIICMSSVHEIIPWAGHANYAASKGGIQMLMKTMAQELAPKKIRVNSICPGAIQTEINHQDWATPEALKHLLLLVPYQRIGQVEDVAKVAVWLASDESDYVNGASIFVDGAMSCYPAFGSNG